jgi:hypothetical protein
MAYALFNMAFGTNLAFTCLRVVCLQCVAGKYWVDSTEQCDSCQPGTWSSAGALSCVQCVKGKYSSASSASSISTCVNCPAGKFSGTLGATSDSTCLTSPAGYYAQAGSEQYIVCPPGTFSDVEAGVCTNCPVGSYCPSEMTKPSPLLFITWDIAKDRNMIAPTTPLAISGNVEWAGGEFCKVGKCVEFDGTNSQSVTLPSLQLGTELRGFTLSFWFMYTGDISTVSPALFDFKGSGPARIVFSKWKSTTHASFSINEGEVIVIPDGFLCNVWAHYVIVVTAATPAVKIYKNGVIAGTYKVTQEATSYTGTASVQQSYVYPNTNVQFMTNYIGKSNTAGTPPYFSGTVDTFGVFPWPVIPTQAVALFNEDTATEMVTAAAHLAHGLPSLASVVFKESCLTI